MDVGERPPVDQTGKTDSVQHERQPPSHEVNQAGHSYIVVNLETGEISITSDAKLASNAKQIHDFVIKYLDTLSVDQLKTLQSLNLRPTKFKGNFTSHLPSWAQKTLIKSESALADLKSFILNRGTSDTQLMKEVKSLSRVLLALKNPSIEKQVKELSDLRDQLANSEKVLRVLQDNAEQANMKSAIMDLEFEISERQNHLFGSVIQYTGISLNDFSQLKNSTNEAIKDNPLLKEFKELATFEPKDKTGKKIDFEKKAQIRVAFPKQSKGSETSVKTGETIIIPTEFSDSAKTAETLIKGKKKEYLARTPNETTVKKRLESHYASKGEDVPNTTSFGVGVTLDKLQSLSNVSFTQLENAVANYLVDGGVVKENAAYIGSELKDFLLELPKNQKMTLEELHEAVKKRVVEHNINVQDIDHETFADLVEAGVGGAIPNDLFNAPEFNEAFKAYRDGSWEPGEEVEITFTHFKVDPRDPVPAEEIALTQIDRLFADPKAQAILQQFI